MSICGIGRGKPVVPVVNGDVQPRNDVGSSGFGNASQSNSGFVSSGFGSSNRFGTESASNQNDFGGSRGGFSGGGGGGRACHNCNQVGHFARECPQSSRGGGSSSGGNRNCYKCGKAGHRSSECPDNEEGGGGSSNNFGDRRRGFGNNENNFGANNSGGFGDSSNNDDRPRGGGGQGFGGGNADGFGNNRQRSGFGGDNNEGGRGRGGFGSNTRSNGAFGDGGANENRQRSNNENDGGESAGGTAESGRKGPQTYEPKEVTDEELNHIERIHSGINFEKYDHIKVQVTGLGEGIDGLQSFNEAGFTEAILRNITLAKWKKPTPVQKLAIPLIMAGHDLMACAQTGSGKTAAYLLPVLSSMIRRGEISSNPDQVPRPSVIIISPTRELAIQISTEAKFFALGTAARVCLLYGGTNVRFQIDQLSRGCNILVATPGRLNHFVDEGKIALSNCRYFILDEADRMLESGFESGIRRIGEHSTFPIQADRQTLMFSATFPKEIQQLAQDFLRPQFAFVTVGTVGGANMDITQEFEQVDKHGKKERLLELLREDLKNSLPGQDGRYQKKTLVFVERKRMADFLATFLSQMEFKSTSIHGDREQQQREEALSHFKTGHCPVLIATAVAARGLDIVGVDHVINFDLPNSVDDYVHRIGRTGRVGNPGRATSFFDVSVDTPLASQLIKILSDAQQVVPDWLQAFGGGIQSDSFQHSDFGGRDIRETDGWNSGSAGNFSSNAPVTGGSAEKWE